MLDLPRGDVREHSLPCDSVLREGQRSSIGVTGASSDANAETLVTGTRHAPPAPADGWSAESGAMAPRSHRESPGAKKKRYPASVRPSALCDRVRGVGDGQALWPQVSPVCNAITSGAHTAGRARARAEVPRVLDFPGAPRTGRRDAPYRTGTRPSRILEQGGRLGRRLPAPLLGTWAR